AVIGGQSSGMAGGGSSKFAGQLGKALWLDASQIANMYDGNVGGLYGGGYRYVKFHVTDGFSQGQVCYLDQSNPPADGYPYLVTDDPDTTTLSSASVAGFIIGTTTDDGHYGFVQFAGIVNALFKNPLSGTGATGRTVFVNPGELNVDILDDLVTTNGAPL